MEKKFILAGKRIYTRQVISIGVIVLLYGFYFWQPDIGCDRSAETELEAYDSLFLVIGLILMFGAIFWITNMKHHTPEGSLLFNALELKIVKGDITEIIPIEMTSGLRLIYKGIEGDVVPYSGFLGMFGMTTTSDGSGNMLMFRFNALDYKLNLVFEAKEDLNAIGHLFREIARIHGFQPELIEEGDE
jgi:hypothetical protein